MSKPFECNVVRFREPADKMCGSDRTSTFVHVPFQSRRMRPNNNRNNRPNFFFFFLFSGVDLAKNLLGGREWSNGYHPDDYLVYPSRSTRVMIDPSMTALQAFEGHIVVIHTGLSIAGRLQPVWITILTQVRIFNIPTILWLVLIVSYLKFCTFKNRKCSTWLDNCQIDGDKCFQQSNAYAAYDFTNA
jgi:hypothetical protein